MTPTAAGIASGATDRARPRECGTRTRAIGRTSSWPTRRPCSRQRALWTKASTRTLRRGAGCPWASEAAGAEVGLPVGGDGTVDAGADLLGGQGIAHPAVAGITGEHDAGDQPVTGAPIYIVCDNLSCNTTPAIRTWAAAHKVELCPTPTNASWADPIEAPVRAAADVHDGQLRLSQPHRPGPRPARLPALAQRQRPTPRRAGRPTPRTRPRPQRTPPPLGSTSTPRGLTKQVIIRGQRTRDP